MLLFYNLWFYIINPKQTTFLSEIIPRKQGAIPTHTEQAVDLIIKKDRHTSNRYSIEQIIFRHMIRVIQLDDEYFSNVVLVS